ncbi:MAG TPA: leucine--tRNA ligase [Myxococcaceae bacterium]|nr:leucine--tRNA ligase [Myxococcaceae bacterium]
MAMQERYEPKTFEAKWQKRWDEAGVFLAGRRPKAPEKYVLEMLPYPSGQMHMGHVRNYLIGEVYARYYWLRGFDVIHPMGWDAFGLPAENAAIKDGVHPAIRTRENIASFKSTLQSLGFSYDWTREIATCDPEYYRWNQWFFLKLLARDMVYRRFSKVNWCTSCLTVIANEQVKEGTCERCGSPVIEKEMPEWAFRITRYSDRLLQALDELREWPERITTMQRNWIGRSEGTEADFAVKGTRDSVRIFTTRIDTIFGCNAVVLAPDHKLVPKITAPAQRAEVERFSARMASLHGVERIADAAEKEGVFTGAYAINPLSKEEVPIWIANFVLVEYGTGAVMSVPAHDQRDFEFARKYRLPIKVVVQPKDGPKLPAGSELSAAFTDDGVLSDSGEFSGLESAEARRRMTAALEGRGLGKGTVTYRQKDWGFSRQRYWGTPIPIVYCEKCDPSGNGIPLREDQLPVLLPDIDVHAVLTGKGEPPLAKVPSFVNTTCPRCGGPARREVETMDTFVDSSWYYARYLSPHYELAPFDPAQARRWLPVDIYIGGPEHAVMHLLYFRFWTRLMKEMGLTPMDEPVQRLVTQGIVNGPDGRKMSKRWGNVIAPTPLVEKFGADTARTYVLFAGPPERDIDWSDDQVEGANRFLKRVWTLAFQYQSKVAGAKHDGTAEPAALQIRRAAHKCLKRVGEAIERLSFNTAIAGIMEFVNALYLVERVQTAAERAAMAEAIHILTIVLSPFAPHLSEEISEAYGHSQLVADRPWPKYDPALVVDEVLPYAVQVNGKLRTEIRVAAESGEAEVRAAAEADEKVRSSLAGKSVRKVVFVPKRLINFVAS